MKTYVRLSVVSFTVWMCLIPGVAYAAPLLTSGYELRLESWLGQGPLDFTNIFTKASGNTAVDFHAAADGKGATFTLLEMIVGNDTYVVGGYNPLSWHLGGNNYSVTDAERTAFIFNLSTDTLQRQRLIGAIPGGIDDTAGSYQTFNSLLVGPSFGGNGSDLAVQQDLGSAVVWQYSYGLGAPCVVGGTSIVGTAAWTEPCFTWTGIDYYFPVGALEVYTFTPTVDVPAVPEPASLLLLGTGLVGLRAWRKRR